MTGAGTFPFRELTFRDRETGETFTDMLEMRLEYFAPHPAKATLSTAESDYLRVKSYGEDAWQAIELVWMILKVELELLSRDDAIMYCGVEWDPVLGDRLLGGEGAEAEDGV